MGAGRAISPCTIGWVTKSEWRTDLGQSFVPSDSSPDYSLFKTFRVALRGTSPTGHYFHQFGDRPEQQLGQVPCVDDTLASDYPQAGHHDVEYHGNSAYLAHQDPASGVVQGPDHGTPHGLVQHHHTATLPTHHPQGQAGMMMDTSQMGHHGMGTPTFGAPGSIITPIYQPMPATQAQGRHTPTGTKRQRPDDMEMPIHSVSNLEHAELVGMHHTHMGAAYGLGVPTHGAGPHEHPTHHHHRLPDSGPFARVRGREEGGGGGAPSVVGQEGMPKPAKRPKGPKLKFTPEDDQLLIDLKEQKNLTWRQIADFFPGRSSGTLQVRYCTKLKAKTKQWNDEMVRRDSEMFYGTTSHPPACVKHRCQAKTLYLTPEQDRKLRAALDDYENGKWRVISSRLGTGFTPAACRERADELWGDAPADVEEATSVPETSGSEQSE